MSEAFNYQIAEIEAVAVAYLSAFNRADVAAVLANYADDGVLMAPGRTSTVGKKNLAKVYPVVFEAVEFRMTYEIREVMQTSINWGFVRSATAGTETVKATGEGNHVTYEELFLLRRSTEGVWQIARYCTTKTSSMA